MKVQDDQDDVFNKMDTGLKEFWEVTGDLLQEHSSKAWENTSGIREKVKGAWDTTGDATKGALDKTGGFFKEKWDKTDGFFR